MENQAIIESFSEFKEEKNIDAELDEGTGSE